MCVLNRVSSGYLGVVYFVFWLGPVPYRIYKQEYSGEVLICGKPMGELKGTTRGIGDLCGCNGQACPERSRFRAHGMPVG